MDKDGQSGRRVIAGWQNFMEAVAAMRLAQKEYFKTKASTALFRAKDLELLVDRTIAEYRERVKRRGDEVVAIPAGHSHEGGGSAVAVSGVRGAGIETQR